MKKLTALCVVALLFSIAPVLAAQQTDSATLAGARAVLAKVPYCSLITVASDGAPHARVVQQFPPEADFTVWIGTNPLSRKVSELMANSHATVFCQEAQGSYVSLIGTGSIVRDTAEKARHWNPAWAGFYKNGYKGDDFVLIKVVPHTLEVVSYPLGLFSKRPDWQAPTVQLRK